MKTRVITSVVGLLVLWLVCTFFYTPFFNLVFAAIALVAVHEVFAAFGFGKKEAYLLAGFVPVIIIIMLSDYSVFRGIVRPACYLFMVFIALCVIANLNRIEFTRFAGALTFSGVVVFCFYSMVYLKSLLPLQQYGYDAMYFTVLTLAFAWGGDTMAYFAGRLFGRHKLAPKVSPNKTVEGAIGGVVGSMLLGVLVTLLYEFLFGRLVIPLEGELSGWYYLVIALLAIPGSLLGITGDLFASAIKRQRGIKDYGKIFPGHGGILDRFDSVLFIAPFVVLVARAVFYRFLA